MSIKNFVVAIFAVASFGTFAMAQQQQPNQPPRDGGGSSGMGRGGDRREMGEQQRRMGSVRVMRMRAPRAGGGGPGRIDSNRLNLTDAQKQRIQTLLETNRRTSETNRAQFEEMAKLSGLKREGLLTTEQGTRLTALQAQMKTNHDRMQSDLLAVLTPEQRILVDQMKNDRGGVRMGRMGRQGDQQPRRMQMRRQMPGAPMQPDRPNPPAQPPTPQND